MRMRLQIRPLMPNSSIPLNYSYYLSTAIYRWIGRSSPEYSSFLHEHGFPVAGFNRRFKHFCFSQLIVPQRRVADFRLTILSPTVDWYISVPVDATLQHLVLGMFDKQEFYIEQEENRFWVERVETLPEPQWKRSMKFRMLSPLTVSVPEARNGKLLPQYLRADDPRLEDALRTNILNKQESLSGTIPNDSEFRCTSDQDFIAQRGGPDRISKLITIKQGQREETKVRGFMCPVTIEGNPDLIKLAYESGLGEKGSLGFGMIEAV